MILRAALCAAITLALGSLAHSQDFRERTSSVSPSIRGLVKAAEALHVAVPDLSVDEESYYLVVSAWANNADLILIASPTIDQSELENAALQLARELGWPSADFIRRERPKVRYVDIELNDYLKRSGDWWSEVQTFSFPIGRICEALRRTPVGSKPWVVFIDCDSADQSELTGLGVTLDPKYGAIVPLANVKEGASLRTTTTIRWFHRAVGLACPLIVLSLFAMPLVTYRRNLRRRIEQRRHQAQATTPEARQELYNEQTKLIGGRSWLIFIPAIGGLLVVPALSLTTSFFSKSLSTNRLILAYMNLPIAFLLLPVLGSVLLILVFDRITSRQLQREAPMPGAPPEGLPKPFQSLLLLATILVPIMIGLTMIPAVRALPQPFRSALIMAPPLTLMISLPFVFWRATVGKRNKLGPGNRWHDEVVALGDAVGVRVRAVFVSDLDAANAFATAAGSIVLTNKLLDQLDHREVRAIAAHELAHLKYRHPLRQLVLSVTFILVLAVTTSVLGRALPQDDMLGKLLRSPFLPVLGVTALTFLLKNPKSRRHELEADLDAVRITGDPDALIRALLKIADANQAVHELQPFDQRLSSHPSIKRRIKALREAFPGSGAFLIEHSSGALIEAPPPGSESRS